MQIGPLIAHTLRSRLQYCVLACLLSLSLGACAEPAPLAPLPSDPAATLKLPAGFKAQVFARAQGAGEEYFHGPRFMAFGPDGNLYLSTGMDNKVVMLPDRDHDGVADEVVLVADKLNAPQGLAFVDDKLLVANQDGVVVLEHQVGEQAEQWPATSRTTLISGLASGGHTLKSLKIGPDGFLYLNLGSSCNVCLESNPMRATILRYNINGKPAGALAAVGRHSTSPVWAWGLRNSEGFAWHPVTGAMYATNNGADMRSNVKGGAPVDELPPEHLNLIEAGQHYGWPYCWGNQQPDPNFTAPANFCADTRAPAITFPAHSAPLGITFLNKSNFPADYKSDAIVALHGSWNRAQPSGYKLVRVKFNRNKPVEVIDFATGWLDKKAAWGRPVDVVIGPDGALYVSDDRAGLVYRISYTGK